MGDKDFDNFNLQIGEIIGNTLDGKDIYKFTELGTAENVMFWEPIFKDGDFVVNEVGSILIFREKVGDSIYDHAFLAGGEMITNPNASSISGIKRYATEEEKQKLLDALAKRGKRWNTEKLCVEDIPKPKFNDGDFVYEDGRIMIFKSYPNNYHCIYLPHIGKPFFDNSYGIDFTAKSFRRATEEEKQQLLDAIAKEGKSWNEEKKCIEDIPARKFKKGDKVRIKEGISSKTHRDISPGFIVQMDDLIGKELTVDRYANGMVYTEESYYLHEDWLEPYEELKKGDLAIFWDDDKEFAALRFYEKLNGSNAYFRHEDSFGFNWKNAIKFESKEQYEKLINGEL